MGYQILGGSMKRYLLLLAMALALVPRGWAASGNITTNGTTCSPSTNCLVVNLPQDKGGATLTISGTWTGTIQFEATGDSSTWTAVSVTPLASTTTVTSTTANGVWQVNTAGFTGLRMRASATVTGSANATITFSAASARNGGGGGGGGSGTVTSIATTSPITGGTITTTGTIGCATCAIGPGSSTANHLAKFSGTDGITLADGGTIPAGTVTTTGSPLSTYLAGFSGATSITGTSAATLDSSGNVTGNTLTSTGALTVGGTNGQLKITEGAAPSGAAGFDWLYADSTAHALKVNNNNGTAAQVILSGADINTSNQVTAQHFTALDLSALAATSAWKPPAASGAAPTTKGVEAYDTGTADGPVFGDGTHTQNVAFIQGPDSTGHCAQFAGDGTGRLVATSGTCGSGSGTVGGSGTSGKVPLWTASTTLGNSAISDNGTIVSTSEPLTMGVDGQINGYAGLTNVSTAPTVVDVGTGGTLAFNTHYYYACVGTNGVGWTAPSNVGSVLTANDSNNTHSITVTCATVTGATGYALLGRTQFFPSTGNATSATTAFTDTGSYTFSGANQGDGFVNTTIGIGLGGSSATTNSPTANDMVFSRDSAGNARLSSAFQTGGAAGLFLGGGNASIWGSSHNTTFNLQAGTINICSGSTPGSCVNAAAVTVQGSLTVSTANSGSGQASAASYVSGGTKFTSNNGCSETTLVGAATAGSFASGTTGTCTLTITFGNSSTAAHAWACFSNDLTTPADLIHQTASTTTTVTLSGTTISGDVVNFACIGY